MQKNCVVSCSSICHLSNADSCETNLATSLSYLIGWLFYIPFLRLVAEIWLIFVGFFFFFWKKVLYPNSKTVIIYVPSKLWSWVHTGPAGASCVETLRQEGFRGRIVFVCKEQALPYDRVKTSKALDVKLDSITFRTASFYKVSHLF